jgi:hypothetical protein
VPERQVHEVENETTTLLEENGDEVEDIPVVDDPINDVVVEVEAHDNNANHVDNPYQHDDSPEYITILQVGRLMKTYAEQNQYQKNLPVCSKSLLYP